MDKLKDKVVIFFRNHLTIANLVFQFIGFSSLIILWKSKDIRQWNLSWFIEVHRPIYALVQREYKIKLLNELKNIRPRDGKILKILEIGIGTGANLEFYPDKCELFTVEPNRSFDIFLTDNLKKYPGIKWMGHVGTHAEKMSQVESNSFDAVVSTDVMCSIEDNIKVLQEIKRVLVKDGKYLFCEHVLDNRNTWIRFSQKLGNITGINAFLGCGCTFKNFEIIVVKVFNKIKGEYFYLNDVYIPVISPHYYGYGTKD